MGYKLLGWAVWKGAGWYVRRRYGRRVKPALAAVLAVAAAGGAAALAGRSRTS